MNVPGTPDLDIPSYFTEDFQLKREEKGLPRCTAYQGPIEESVSEDPPPPTHVSRSSTLGSHPKE